MQALELRSPGLGSLLYWKGNDLSQLIMGEDSVSY